MYEIWLMLNIVYEWALSLWPVALGLALAWLALMALAARGRHSWRANFPGAIVVGLLVGVAAFFIMPGLIKSSLAELKYWVDWITLLGMAAASAATGALLAWPLLTWLRKPGFRGH